MTPTETEAIQVINASLDRLQMSINRIADRLDELSDRINGYHGDTVSQVECERCQGRWVS